MGNWLRDMFFGKQQDETPDRSQNRDSVVPNFLKEAAYEYEELRDETIERDWKRLILGLSDFVLAEQLCERELQGMGLSEKYSECFHEALCDVRTNRKKAEDRLFKLLPRHSQLGTKEFFERIKEQAAKEAEANTQALAYYPPAGIEENKNEGIKKEASARFKVGDELHAKVCHTCAVVVYINEEAKTYTIKVDGVMYPSYYAFEDAHKTFEKEKDKKEKNKKKESSQEYILEVQDEKGFWNVVKKSTFYPDVEITAELLTTADKSVRISQQTLRVNSAKFKKDQRIIQEGGDVTDVAIIVGHDAARQMYLVDFPGRKLPIYMPEATVESEYKALEEETLYKAREPEFGPTPSGNATISPEEKKTHELEKVFKNIISLIEKLRESEEYKNLSALEFEKAIKDNPEYKKLYEEKAKLEKELEISEVPSAKPGEVGSGRLLLKERDGILKNLEEHSGDSPEEKTKRDVLLKRLDDIYKEIKEAEKGWKKREGIGSAFKTVGRFVISKGKKCIRLHAKDFTPTVPFTTEDKTQEGFDSLKTENDVKSFFDLDVFASLNEISSDYLARDEFQDVISEVAKSFTLPEQNELARQAILAKKPELNPETVESILRRAEAQKKAEHVAPGTISHPEGKEPDPTSSVSEDGTGVYIDPNRGGVGVMKVATENVELMIVGQVGDDGYREIISLAGQVNSFEDLWKKFSSLHPEHKEDEALAEYVKILFDASKGVKKEAIMQYHCPKCSKNYTQALDVCPSCSIPMLEQNAPGVGKKEDIPMASLDVERIPEGVQGLAQSPVMTKIAGKWFCPKCGVVAPEKDLATCPRCSGPLTYSDEMKKEAEAIPGGLASGKSLEDIAKKHNVPVEKIKEQLDMGVKVELEHTGDEAKAKEISMDHLVEDAEYYTKLQKMEMKKEAGDTFEVGEVALLNTTVGSLKEGSEVRIIGMQNTSVIFEAAHNVNIKGFTKFATLDKIAAPKPVKFEKEDYPWLNEDTKVAFNNGEWVKVGSITVEGSNLKGKEGIVREKVIVSAEGDKLEFFYLVEFPCCGHSYTLPGDVLKRKNTPKPVAWREVEDTPRDYETGVHKEAHTQKEAVTKPNLDTVQKFLDGFKVPPTVVSDTMVQEFMQENNYMATKKDLKEIYALLQANNIEVRVTVPSAAPEEAEVAMPATTEAPVEMQKQAVKYKTTVTNADGTSTSVEKEMPSDMGPELEVANPDGTKTKYTKV